jgi:hypothetical protein
MRATLTKYFTFLFAITVALCTGGIVATSYADGPEGVSSKEKNPIVEVPTCNPHWYVSVSGGADINVGGDLNNSHTAILNPVGSPLNPFIGPGASTFPVVTEFVAHHNWDDVYDTGYRAEAEAGWMATEHFDLFVLFKYEHATADDRTHGTNLAVNFGPPFDGGPTLVFPITSKFTDYNSYGFEVGGRWFLMGRNSRFKPFIQVSGGPTHTDRIDIATFTDFSSVLGPAFADVNTFHGGFFQPSLVGTVSAQLGVEYDLACRWAIGVQGGFRYESPLEDDDHDFNRHNPRFFFPTVFPSPPFGPPPGLPVSYRPLSGINNNTGDRWLVPISGYIKYRW